MIQFEVNVPTDRTNLIQVASTPLMVNELKLWDKPLINSFITDTYKFIPVGTYDYRLDKLYQESQTFAEYIEQTVTSTYIGNGQGVFITFEALMTINYISIVPSNSQTSTYDASVLRYKSSRSIVSIATDWENEVFNSLSLSVGDDYSYDLGGLEAREFELHYDKSDPFYFTKLHFFGEMTPLADVELSSLDESNFNEGDTYTLCSSCSFRLYPQLSLVSISPEGYSLDYANYPTFEITCSGDSSNYIVTYSGVDASTQLIDN